MKGRRCKLMDKKVSSSTELYWCVVHAFLSPRGKSPSGSYTFVIFGHFVGPDGRVIGSFLLPPRFVHVGSLLPRLLPTRAFPDGFR